MTTPERYQLLDELGRGGMGVVYRARDTQLGREIALKLLPAALTQEQTALRRFQHEAQIVAQLEHPHIVPIYDIGVRHDQPFIVMRLLRGGSLQERLRAGQMEPETLWRVLRQVGMALDAIHTQHIIHRDIKPTNILFDENGQAYLADFGIAKALDATTQYTGNAIIGSPAYMSPEQFVGDVISGKADQYSIAVVAFEALAGQPLFQGNTWQLMNSHLQQPPPALSTINHHLPSVLDKVLQRALAKDPAERYDTVEAFVNALERAAKSSTKPLPPILETQAVLPEEAEKSDAKAKASSAISSRTERIRLLYQQGLDAFEAEEWVDAAAAFRHVLDLDPQHTNALNRYQQVQQKLKPDATIVYPSPPLPNVAKPTPRPQPVSHIDAPAPYKPQIVKGAGGNTGSVKRQGKGRRWLIAGVGLVLVLVVIGVAAGLIGNSRTQPTLSAEPVNPTNTVAIAPTQAQATPEISNVGILETATALAIAQATTAAMPSPELTPSPTETTLPSTTPTATSQPSPTHTSTPTLRPTNTPTPTATRTPTLVASLVSATATLPPPTAASNVGNATPTLMPIGNQATGNPSQGPGFPLNFTNFGRWVRGDQPNGTIQQTSEQSRSGAAARIDYSFGTASNDFVVFLQTNDIPGQPNVLSAWVYGDGAGHYFNIWIIDNDGQTWQVPLGRITHTGWREMVGLIDTSQNWPWTHISGPNNGVVDYPIRFRAFVLDDVNDAYIGSGTIYVDDVTSRADAQPIVPTSPPPPVGTAPPVTPVGTASPTPAPAFTGNVGRIIYTSGNILLTTDPSWTSPQELGTASSDSCSNPASTVAGQSFNLYFSPFCALGEGTRVCASPNGQHEVIFNGTFADGFTMSVRATGSEGTGTFIYGGSDFDLPEGVRWSPLSNRFLFVLGDTVHAGFPQGGYSMIIPTAYNPSFSADGSLILYRKPIGPGVNDVFVANADGTDQRNVTNVNSIDKRCAAWVR